MRIAFDLQGVLISDDIEKSQSMIGLLKILKNAGHFIIVWSGEDTSKIRKQIRKIGIEDYVNLVVRKMNIDKDMLPDIAFDDNELNIARFATIKM